MVNDQIRFSPVTEVEPIDDGGADFGTDPQIDDHVDQIRGGVLYARESVDELHGIDVLGLLPQAGSKLGKKFQQQQAGVGFTEHTMKTGQGFIKISTRASNARVPETAITKARTVARNAQQLATRLQHFTSKRRRTKPAHVVVGLTSTSAGGAVIRKGVQAAAGGPGRYRIVVRVPSDAQVRSMAAALAKAASKLNRGADAHQQRVDDLRNAGRASVRANHILGADYYVGAYDGLVAAVDEVEQLMGYGWAEIIGQGPDPSNPGYLTDGSIDPNYQSPTSYDPNAPGGGGGAAAAPSSAAGWSDVVQMDTDRVAGLPGPENSDPGPYGLPQRPTDYGAAVAFEKFLDPAAQSLEDAFAAFNDPNLNARTSDGSDGGPAADQTFYFTNPDDASRISQSPRQLDPIASGIVYKVGHIPFLNVGSYTVWFGTYQGLTPNGGPGSGLELHEDGWYRWRAQYEDDTHRTYDKRLYKQDDENAQQLLADSVKQNFGPLMGRPDMQILWTPGEGRDRKDPYVPEAANLRFDCSTGGFFWFWNAAPEQYKLQRRLAYVAQAQLDWDSALTAAKSNYLQAVATLAADKQAADEFNRNAASDNETLQHQIDVDTKKQQAAEAAAQSQANVMATQTGAAQQAAQLDYDKQSASLSLRAFEQGVLQQPPSGAFYGDGDVASLQDDADVNDPVDAMADPSEGLSDGSDLQVDPAQLTTDDVDWGET